MDQRVEARALEVWMMEASVDRRLFLYALGASALLTGFGLSARAAAENRILAIAYDNFAPQDPNGDHMRDNLLSTGSTVTWVRGPGFGRLASELAQGLYDQVWIWDLVPSNFANVNDADRAALATWFVNHRSVVLDSRSIGVWFENDASEVALSRNVVANLASRGGGLWIGAKQAPDFTAANRYLSTLGFNPFAGDFFDLATLTATENPLLTNPNVVNVAGLRWGAAQGAFSRSAAPTGPQPNGLTLQTVVSDSHGNPLITTNIPEPPGAGFMGGLGAGLLGWTRRRR